jgi:hypothetical protein
MRATVAEKKETSKERERGTLRKREKCMKYKQQREKNQRNSRLEHVREMKANEKGERGKSSIV